MVPPCKTRPEEEIFQGRKNPSARRCPGGCLGSVPPAIAACRNRRGGRSAHRRERTAYCAAGVPWRKGTLGGRRLFHWIEGCGIGGPSEGIKNGRKFARPPSRSRSAKLL